MRSPEGPFGHEAMMTTALNREVLRGIASSTSARLPVIELEERSYAPVLPSVELGLELLKAHLENARA